VNGTNVNVIYTRTLIEFVFVELTTKENSSDIWFVGKNLNLITFRIHYMGMNV